MDFTYALRSLRKNGGFTFLAVLVMGLGIGANTAMFSVVNTVLLKPLRFRDPDRIVTLSSQWKNSTSHGQVSAPDFHDWHDQSTSFRAMALYDSDPETAIESRAGAEYASAAEVSQDFFRVFEVEPTIGRFFSADESRPGSAGAVLISYNYWRNHFGADPQVLGQNVRMQGKSFPIVGVLPPLFQFPDKTDIWIPANTVFPETSSRSAHNYLVVGKLKPGVSIERAQSEMTGIGARLEQQYPGANRNKGVAVTRMRDEMVGDVRTTLYLLLGAVGLVLLIACANMANLLLAKATSRTREIAIRSAVGASRWRIVKQLITESVVLALLSGIAGLLLAIWGSKVLVAIAPKDVPRLGDTTIDAWVLAFTFGVSIVACLLFGVAPAIHASRVNLNDALKQGAARATVGGGAGRLRAALVVAEIALSVVLLTGAGLLMRSFLAMLNVTLGFRTENVLVMGATVPATDLESSRRASRFYRDLLAAINTTPGVTAAGASRTPPGHVGSWGGYWIDHLPAREAMGVSGPQAVFSVIAPGTFNTLGISLKRGRDFNDGDVYDAPFTAVINESLARASFAGQDPVGHVIYCGLDSMNGMKIVGVVADIRQYGPARPPQPEIYMPYQQHPRPAASMSVLVRTAANPAALFEAIRRQSRSTSADVPVKFTTLETLLADNVAAPRFRTLLLGIFAGLAVALAMAGVYGVMAYVVGQRANEIGLRMALGASPGKVMRLVLGQGLALAGIGLVIGLAGAVAATRLLTKMLYEVKPGDPLTYAGVVVLLALVTLVASYLPARRATKVDPLAALRQE
ncbi:MAG TPA: ABC transporter permease [Bryobacteraceae bacterium]|nr:ABC transporter permease [Bryobacteraceae bacterium]